MSGDRFAFPAGEWTQTLVRRALAEDVGSGDVSTAVAVAPGRTAGGRLVARDAGVIAGLPLVSLVFAELSPAVRVAPCREDGAAVAPGEVVARVQGPAAALLTGERTALNFLQHLSGIATLTARYVAAVSGTGCLVLDTRKTVPGFRALAKYAVRCGGGANHRLGLHDRFLFKDNHWAVAAGRLPALVAAAKAARPDLAVEVEVDSLAQLAALLPLGVDWILLDNFTPAQVAAAVAARDAADGGANAPVRPRLEVSGNVTLDNARAYAEAGADAISIGRLTHSAPALDVGLDFEPEPREPGA